LIIQFSRISLIILSKYIRATLKEQMEQKVQTDKNELEQRNRATEMIIEQDRQYLEQEKQRQNERAKLLSQVTAKNKEVRKEKIFLNETNIIFLLF